MLVIINGEPVGAEDASISVYDWGLLRGDGCFESIRVYGGRPFAAAEHLDRLETSAAIMGLPLPDRRHIHEWIDRVAGSGEPDGVIRVVATRGGMEPQISAEPRLLVMAEALPDLPDAFRLLPVRSPWHAGGDYSELTGAKTLSYAANVAATRRARDEGFDDALLVSRDGWVLEGPTFCVAWFIDGALETPELELGILKSITRTRALLLAEDLGVPVREGRFALERIAAAEEVLALSTIKEVAPVRAVGDHEFEPGPVTAKLAQAFAGFVTSQTGW